MTRQLTFRGKREHNGEWVYGYYLRHDKSLETKIHFETESGMGTTIVIPETVGQYTGLKDINEQSIYEGDCLGRESNVVQFINGCFTINGYMPLAWFCTQHEVVGNIHEFDKVDK